jgi:hypothetical protein
MRVFGWSPPFERLDPSAAPFDKFRKFSGQVSEILVRGLEQCKKQIQGGDESTKAESPVRGSP